MLAQLELTKIRVRVVGFISAFDGSGKPRWGCAAVAIPQGTGDVLESKRRGARGGGRWRGRTPGARTCGVEQPEDGWRSRNDSRRNTAELEMETVRFQKSAAAR